MSDFFNPHEIRRARKAHRCIYCSEEIHVGESYVHQTGVSDGRWYTSKMHQECFQELCDSGDFEFTPNSNERPQQGKVMA